MWYKTTYPFCYQTLYIIFSKVIRMWASLSIFVKMEYVCKELIGEYKAVVQRPKLKKYIGEKDVLDTLELMSLYCFCVDIEKPAVSPIRDVKDLYLLSLADTIPADYIISGDKDLLVLGKHNETRILDYNSFLSLL